MTTPVFPTLPGLMFPVSREVLFKTQVQEAQSGKETRTAFWSAPRYLWEMSFEFLRVNATVEFQTLFAFALQQKGRFNPFLYADTEDYAVTGQAIGTGDGVTTTFQLSRTFTAGGFTGTEPILAPNTSLTKVAKVAGVVTAATWNDYDAATPGSITFAVAPAAAAAITADFSFYWPCRVDEDSIDFNKVMSTYYDVKTFRFRSIK